MKLWLRLQSLRYVSQLLDRESSRDRGNFYRVRARRFRSFLFLSPPSITIQARSCAAPLWNGSSGRSSCKQFCSGSSLFLSLSRASSPRKRKEGNSNSIDTTTTLSCWDQTSDFIVLQCSFGLSSLSFQLFSFVIVCVKIQFYSRFASVLPFRPFSLASTIDNVGTKVLT